ncbi:O-antigen ligase family protein [Bacillus infantis]|uniref:O-antigen ligase family protein n=1 Tax=Bacillus infantis TaxID=324767 RepID=UPI003CE7A954
MPVKKISLLVLLLTFLSGTFTLDRLNLGFSIEVRYVLICVFVLISLAGLKKTNAFEETPLKSNLVPFISTIIIYVLFSGISLVYTIDQISAIEKISGLVFLLLLILGVVFVGYNMVPRDFFNVTSMFFIIIGIVYVAPVFVSVLMGASRGDVNLSGPNVATRILFFASCASLYRYYLSNKIFYFAVSLFYLASIVLVGSRGGLVGAFVTLAVMFAIKKILVPWKLKMPTLTYKKIFLFPLVIGLLFFLYHPVKKVFNSRIIETTFSGDQVYTSGRDLIYTAAVRMIKEKPLFGHGVDSFTAYTGYVYPHNLLLEMMVEIGLVGALFFLVFLCYAISFMFKNKNSPTFILSGLPLYMIVVQMFSGEFYDFRYFFLWSIPFLIYKSAQKIELTPTVKTVKEKKKWKKYKIVW